MDGGDHSRLPVVLLAVHAGADHFERQGAFDEDHLAVGPVGNALGLDVQGFDVQDVGRKGGIFSGFVIHVSIVHEPWRRCGLRYR